MKARANTLLTTVRGYLLVRVGVLATLTMLLLALVCVSAASATTFTVTNTNDSGPGSLRVAIQAANANADADEIVFADGVSGTITLSSTLSKVTDPAGLTIDGGGDVTVSGNDAVQAFVVGQGARLDLRNLTVSGGSPTSEDRGIYNDGGTLVVTDSTISGNGSGFSGGGIFNAEGGLVEVSGSTISGNFVFGWGGGIYNEQSGTVIVTDSTFHNNEVGDYGGGIFNRRGGKVEVTDSTFSGNHAADTGAGIANFGTLTVSGSTFSDNIGDFDGGGIYNEGEQLKVTNSTFFGNEGGFGGGGILSYGGQVEVVNSTISNNTSFEGAGGVYGGLFTLRNTIVANNAGGNCGWSPAQPPVVDGGYNVDDDGTCGFTQATGSLPNTDPLLDPAGLVDNGGPTKTIALQPESPAVDLVGQGACPPPATDQRAVERPQGEACDSGAFELEQQATPKPPSVTGTFPKTNATEVAPTANIRATFSEDMKASTINGTTFKLFKKGTTTQIAAQVSYNADTDTAKLDPANNLRRGVAYKAVVTTWAKDEASNRLDQDSSTSGLQQMRWFFRVDD